MKKICIGFMSDYTYGDYVYFKNMTDTPNKHYIGFILNEIYYRYITSPLKFIDKIFESLPNLFVDQILYKIDECPYPNCGSVIKNKCMEQR